MHPIVRHDCTADIAGLGLTRKPYTFSQEGATMRPDAFDFLRAVLGAVGMVYVITHVEDDVGEATVRGALEAVGLVGSRPGQIPPHRC